MYILVTPPRGKGENENIKKYFVNPSGKWKYTGNPLFQKGKLIIKFRKYNRFQLQKYNLLFLNCISQKMAISFVKQLKTVSKQRFDSDKCSLARSEYFKLQKFLLTLCYHFPTDNAKILQSLWIQLELFPKFVLSVCKFFAIISEG